MQKIKSGNPLMIINIILPIVIVAGAIALLLQNHLYNSRERVCDFSNATREGTSMIFDDVIVNLMPRGGDSGSWVSTNLCDWSVMIRIPEDMCLNDAWDGEVELHQNVNSDNEQIQTIKIPQYSKYDITIEHYITHAGLMVNLY